MLLQGQNGIVRVFPALPPGRDASFVDLRVEGPLLVSAQRRGGNVAFVRLRALADVSSRLRSPWPGQTVWRATAGSAQSAAEVPNGRYLEVCLGAGEELVYAPERQALHWQTLVTPRQGEPPQARSQTFADGMMVWLGKPEPQQYYAALAQARGSPQPRPDITGPSPGRSPGGGAL
jgi:hypothetical protein